MCHMNMDSCSLLLVLMLSLTITSTEDRNGRNYACNCVCDDSPFQGDRILSGTSARVNEFPFLVGLYDGAYLCGGAIVTPLHVLTAAHCIKDYMKEMQLDPQGEKEIIILIGAHNIEEPTFIRYVAEMRYHKKHDKETNNHDIGIVKMNDPVGFNEGVQPACLPFRGDATYTDNVGIVAGWGTTSEEGFISKMLEKVAVPLVDRSKCVQNYAIKDIDITENMICAGEGVKDACKGDSGGPLLARNAETGVEEIIGIVSFGRGCGRAEYPGVYTKVTNYVTWISRQIGPECLCVPKNT